ncbi:MAG: hypothetical protein V1894_04845 [Chloroflexota bacterium]
MAQEKTVSGVAAVELQAEEMLKKARLQASEILVRADEEIKRISASEIALAPVVAEYNKMLESARKEADKGVAESRVKASAIKTSVAGKIAGVVARIVNEVAGVASR